MRNFLLLCMAALCCLACNDSKIVTVTVTNPLAMDRSDEMVEVSMTEISNLLNLADTAQIVVLNVVVRVPPSTQDKPCKIHFLQGFLLYIRIERKFFFVI